MLCPEHSLHWCLLLEIRQLQLEGFAVKHTVAFYSKPDFGVKALEAAEVAGHCVLCT